MGETASGGAQDLPVTGSVIPNPEAGLINVRATAKQHEAVQSFIDRVMANAQRQVLIEATVVEVDLSDQYRQGIDWRVINEGTGLDAFQLLTGSLAPGLASAVPPVAPLGIASSFVLNYTSKSDGQRIDVVVELLRQFGDLQVLSSPRIMALNNQPAVLKVVENIVYFEIDVEPGVATGNTQSIPAIETTAKTVPVGLVMTVTPQVNENQSVTLDMRPTISSITQFVNDPSPDLDAAGTVNAVPQIQVREMELGAQGPERPDCRARRAHPGFGETEQQPRPFAFGSAGPGGCVLQEPRQRIHAFRARDLPAPARHRQPQHRRRFLPLPAVPRGARGTQVLTRS